MISKKSLFSSLRSVFLCPKITLPFGNDTVFVANLSFNTDWAELKDYFKQAGNVTFAKVLSTPEGKSKGVGFVQFEDESQAQKAIELLNEKNWNGRVIRVNYAEGNNKTAKRSPQKYQKRDNEGEDNEGSNREKSSNQLEEDFSNSSRINVSVHQLEQENAWKNIQDAFNKCGDVLKVNINKENDENVYVLFEKENSVEKAMKIIKNISISGKKINLESGKK